MCCTDSCTQTQGKCEHKHECEFRKAVLQQVRQICFECLATACVASLSSAVPVFGRSTNGRAASNCVACRLQRCYGELQLR